MYRIIGADGREYGPISAEQMRQWIAEGRVNAQTRVLVEGTTAWKTLADLPEFTPQPAAAPAPLPPMGALPSMPGAFTVPPAEQVNGPGICLIIIGALNIMICMAFAAMVLGNIGLSSFQSGATEAEKMFRGIGITADMIFLSIAFLIGLVILFGGVKLRKLEGYGLGMTASILAMLPCLSCCFPLGIPVGIWTIVVMSRPEVKNAFH